MGGLRCGGALCTLVWQLSFWPSKAGMPVFIWLFNFQARLGLRSSGNRFMLTSIPEAIIWVHFLEVVVQQETSDGVDGIQVLPIPLPKPNEEDTNTCD
jgi:hypothetical protein